MLLAFAVVFAIVGCTKQPNVIGKWERKNGGQETVEYFKDGTFVAHAQGRTMTGKYTILDDRRIKIELGGTLALAGAFVSNYTLSGDVLTMSGPDGSVGTYRRVE